MNRIFNGYDVVNSYNGGISHVGFKGTNDNISELISNIESLNEFITNEIPDYSGLVSIYIRYKNESITYEGNTQIIKRRMCYCVNVKCYFGEIIELEDREFLFKDSRDVTDFIIALSKL